MKIVCSVCGGEADYLALVKGAVVCFACLAERYRDVAALLVRYLVQYKGVRS